MAGLPSRANRKSQPRNVCQRAKCGARRFSEQLGARITWLCG